MSNRFQIDVVATDKATAVINRVNKAISKTVRPITQVKRKVAALHAALGRNDIVRGSLWGFERLGQGITTFGGAFGMAESSVLSGTARVAAALGSIGGPFGGLLAATAAAAGGAAAVSVRMGQLGLDITRTAQSLNIGTRQLQEYRGAARMAGLETGTMDSALGALGSTLYDANAGINQTAAYALSYARISLKRTRDGAIDTVQALRDIADVVKQMPNATEQRKFTDMLGVSELLPLLREGSRKLDEYIVQVRRTGGVMSDELVEKNKKQADAWNRTKQAIDGATTSVGNYVASLVNLDAVANTVSKLAERKEREGVSLRGVAADIWNHFPLSAPMRWIFGEMNGSSAPGRPKAPQRKSQSGRFAAGRVESDSIRAPVAPNLPRGIRSNNPGNLRSWPGAKKDGGYAVFPTPQAGLAAMAKNLTAYQDRHGIRTISEIVHRWAPASDSNDERSYVASLVKQTGFGADQRLNLHDPTVLAPLVSAITKQENGQNPYDPDAIARAVADAVREAMTNAESPPVRLEFVNVPQGVTVRAGGGLGRPFTGLIMAPGGAS